MAPKKKTITAIVSSGAERPVPVWASGEVLAGGSQGTAREHPHRSGSQSLASGVVRARDDGPHAAKSKDGAGPPAGGAEPSKDGVVPPMGGAATSKMPTPAPTTRSSQVVRGEQRHHAGDPGRRPGKSPARPSRDEGGQPARRGAGENGRQPQGLDRAPSNVVRSRSVSRSTQLLPPPTPAEALARAIAP